MPLNFLFKKGQVPSVSSMPTWPVSRSFTFPARSWWAFVCCPCMKILLSTSTPYSPHPHHPKDRDPFLRRDPKMSMSMRFNAENLVSRTTSCCCSSWDHTSPLSPPPRPVHRHPHPTPLDERDVRPPVPDFSGTYVHHSIRGALTCHSCSCFVPLILLLL